MKLLFTLSIFISSFLLFLIQPMLAKALLPFVGGAPAVWIASMLFFQCILLLGYGYAALGSAFLAPKKQLALHIMLFVVAIVLVLPIQLNTPLDFNQTQPEIWVAVTLLLSIGLPYFVLTSNSSLIQRWYHHSFNATPYFLFSISNVGSMLGLLSYPFLIEWTLPLSGQMHFFSIGFILLALIIMVLSRRICTSEAAPSLEGLGRNLTLPQAGKITFLGFIPSSLFLGVTLYVTTDLASFPLLWVIPLSLYLLSFIMAFSKRGATFTAWAQRLHPIAFLGIIIASLFVGHIWLIVPHFVCFFIIAVSCHGRVALEKPPENYLTAYYFWLSVGGALGGLFNTLAPYVFNDVYEYYAIVLLSLFALPSAHLAGKKLNLPEPKKALPIVGLLLVAVLYIQSSDVQDHSGDQLLFQERNFFGISKVKRNERLTYYLHGTTLHTLQPVKEEEKLQPTAYYVPIINFINTLPGAFFEQPFGVLGLGGGTTACMGRSGQELDFFEIDPIVIKVAKNSELFSYIRDCPPTINIIQGDGRLKLVEQPDKRYNLLVMDAFTSDAVPLHLITKDAVSVYVSKLVPSKGVLAFNISNRHLDLKNVLARIAEEFDMQAYVKFYVETPELEYDYTSNWMIMLPKDSPWHEQIVEQGFTSYDAEANTPLWTDDYSNLLPIIK